MFSCSEDDSNIDTTNEITVVDEILNLVNEHRQSQSLSILAKSATAEELAIDHSKYMISQGRISHDNRDAKFQTLQEKENARSFGENVASGQNSAQSVMTGWLNSSGHRANIEGNYTHIGIAAVKDENGRFYYTQIFYR
ncbi:CAP domain-containing protein [Aquimarina celericrescens]|nr:CAP domain-containing protein [Aquimarina celericrescens]